MAAPLDAALATRLVEPVLRDGENVLEVRAGSEAALVFTSHRSWRLVEVDDLGGRPVGPGYRVFAARSATTDPDDPLTGLTLLPDGRAINLSDDGGPQAFVDAVPGVDPLVVGCLVAAFADPGEHARRLLPGDQPGGRVPSVVSKSPTVVRVLTTSTLIDRDDDLTMIVEQWDVTVGPAVSWVRRRI